MNEYYEAEARDSALLAEIAARGEVLRRADLWTAALVHAALLIITFLAVFVLFDAAADIWPSLRSSPQPLALNGVRLALLGMAAWVFVSTARRGIQTSRMEIDLLRAEIREIQLRAAHS